MTESVPGHVHTENIPFQKRLHDAVLPARQCRLVALFVRRHGLSQTGTARPGLDHRREGKGTGLPRHGGFRGDQSADLLFRQKTVHLVLAAAQGGDPLLRHADRTAQRPEFGFSRGQRVHLRVGQGNEKIQHIPADGLPQLLHVGLALRGQPGLKEIQLSGQRRPFPGINIAAEHGVPQRLIAPGHRGCGHGTDGGQQNTAHASVPPLDVPAALRRRPAAVCTRQRKLSGLNSRLMPP